MKKDPVGSIIKVNAGRETKNVKDAKFLTSTKKVLAETQAVNGCGLNKYAYKSLSQQVKTPSGQNRIVLDRGLDTIVSIHRLVNTRLLHNT